MKRLLALILFAVLLLSLCISCLATGEPGISLRADKTSLKEGESATVTVRLENTAPIKALSLRISYDSTVFTLGDGSWLLQNTALSNYNKTMGVAAANYSTDAFPSTAQGKDLNGDVLFFTVTAKTDAAIGESTLTVVPTAKDKSGNDVSCAEDALKLSIVRSTEPDEFQLADAPAGDDNTTITPPEGGWTEGENTFTVAVTGENPYSCVVLLSNDGGETYTRLPASENPDGSHSFTASDVTEDTIIRVMRKGDPDGDGFISSLELTQTRLAQAGLTELTALAMAAADLNGDGTVSPLELTRIRLSAAGLADIPW